MVPEPKCSQRRWAPGPVCQAFGALGVGGQSPVGRYNTASNSAEPLRDRLFRLRDYKSDPAFACIFRFFCGILGVYHTRIRDRAARSCMLKPRIIKVEGSMTLCQGSVGRYYTESS